MRLPINPPIAAPATPAARCEAVLPPNCEPTSAPASAPTAVPAFSLAPWPVSGVAAQAARLPPTSTIAANVAGDMPPPNRVVPLRPHHGALPHGRGPRLATSKESGIGRNSVRPVPVPLFGARRDVELVSQFRRRRERAHQVRPCYPLHGFALDGDFKLARFPDEIGHRLAERRPLTRCAEQRHDRS